MNTSEAAALEEAIDQAVADCDFGRAETLVDQYIERTPRGEEADLPRALWFRARFLGARASLAAGHLEPALRRVLPLLSLTEGLPTGLYARIWLTAAEANARLCKYEEARRYVANAEKAAPFSEPGLEAQRLRIHLWLGEVTTLSAELAACYRLLEDDVDNHVLLLCEEGRAWESKGDLARAESCWRHAIGLARGLNASPIRADVFLQLGRLEHLRGALADAIDAYDQAMEAAISGTAQAEEIRLRRMLVELDLNLHDRVRVQFLRLRDNSLAGQVHELRGLTATLAVLLNEDSCDDAEAANQSDELRGYRAASQGDRKSARASYGRALQRERAAPRRARLLLSVGLLAVADRNADEAEQYIEEAEGLARKHGFPEVLWRCLQARGQILAELREDDEAARTCFEEAIRVAERQRGGLSPFYAAAYDAHRLSATRQLLLSAARRGDVAAFFQNQELDRGRFLLDLWTERRSVQERVAPDLPPRIRQIDEELRVSDASQGHSTEPLRRCELTQERDRLLEQYLSQHGRQSKSVVPEMASVAELRRVLPENAVYVAPALIEDDVFLLAVRRNETPRLLTASSAREVTSRVNAFRACVESQRARYAAGFAMGSAEKAELDHVLEQIGGGPLGELLEQAVGSAKEQRLIWAPDLELHGLPVHALRRQEKYFVESHDVCYCFSGSWIARRLKARRRRRWGRPLVVTESTDILPFAEEEGRGVASTFLLSRILNGVAADRSTIGRCLAGTTAAHFACHAFFDAASPLNSMVRLPSGEDWRSVEWLSAPLDDLPLMTLSACRSAEVSQFVGREVFGLVVAALSAGVRNIVAGLWSVPDKETASLMWQFYRYRMLHDPTRALALAQRSFIAGARRSPLEWAVFGVFSSDVLRTTPWWLTKYWRLWRQRAHASRFR